VTDEICFKPAVELAALIRTKDISPIEIVDNVISRAEQINPKINGLITKSFDLARETAKAAEEKLLNEGASALGPIEGLPITIKDLTPTAGVITTYGVREYEANVPEEDAPIVDRIRCAGGAIMGKSSTPPFGWLGVTENEVIGRTNNPWDLSRTVGGSSGGAAALVAAGVGHLATGSDGGGSIRLPAAMTGIVGHKASIGRIPRHNESGLFEIVDVVGPMARTVADAALLFGVMAGPSQDEPIMMPEENVDYVADLRASTAAGLRIAFSPDLGHGPVDPEVAEVVKNAADHFEQVLGARVNEVKIDIPDPNEYFMIYYMPQFLNLCEKEPGLVRMWEKYPEAARWKELMTSMPAEKWWNIITESRHKNFSAFADIFHSYDILLTPTAPVTAWKHNGAFGPTLIEGVSIKYPIIDFFRFTEPFGHSGHPALSLNCGFTKDRMPVGLQVVGPMRDDKGVFQAAAAYEASTKWLDRRPQLVEPTEDKMKTALEIDSISEQNSSR
jgi:Asp-tRNA(Asn)/Glu-tRNA(Gln) amidotransferase A subunit family amidase